MPEKTRKMTLERTIKFYEKNLETERIQRAKEQYEFWKSVYPEQFVKREQQDKQYLNILIQEYLEQGGIKGK